MRRPEWMPDWLWWAKGNAVWAVIVAVVIAAIEPLVAWWNNRPPSLWGALSFFGVALLAAYLYSRAMVNTEVQATAKPDAASLVLYRPTLLTVSFDYVPAQTPTDRDWKVAEQGMVTFSRPADAPGSGYLQMEVPGRFAMDRPITEAHAQLSRTLEFKVKLPRRAAIYAGVWLKDRENKKVLGTRDKGIFWIVYYLGDSRLAPELDERVDNEIVVRMSGPIIGNGWTVCSRDLEADAQFAYPGLFYSSLEKIRLRGRENTLSISPIRFLGA